MVALLFSASTCSRTPHRLLIDPALNVFVHIQPKQQSYQLTTDSKSAHNTLCITSYFGATGTISYIFTLRNLSKVALNMAYSAANRSPISAVFPRRPPKRVAHSGGIHKILHALFPPGYTRATSLMTRILDPRL